MALLLHDIYIVDLKGHMLAILLNCGMQIGLSQLKGSVDKYLFEN